MDPKPVYIHSIKDIYAKEIKETTASRKVDRLTKKLKKVQLDQREQNESVIDIVEKLQHAMNTKFKDVETKLQSNDKSETRKQINEMLDEKREAVRELLKNEVGRMLRG